MMTILKITRRRYWREDRATQERAYCSVAKAHRWIEATIEIGFHRDTSKLDRGFTTPILDALREGRFAEANEIAWSNDAPLGLSITGVDGYVISPSEARRRSQESYAEYYSDEDALVQANEMWGTNYRSPDAAARYARSFDGEYAGVEIHDEIRVGRGDRLLEMSSCGCIHDEIREAFPEFWPLIRNHLCDMKAGAPDQITALAVESAKRASRKDWTQWSSEAHLESLGILESQSDEEIFVTGFGRRSARGYRYGSSWVASKIPDAVLAIVRDLVLADDSAATERAA